MLLCNQREAAAIAGVSYAGRRPTWAELDETMQRLREAGAPLVVVTLGSDGAIAGGRGTLTLTLTLTQTLTLTPTPTLTLTLTPTLTLTLTLRRAFDACVREEELWL